MIAGSGTIILKKDAPSMRTQTRTPSKPQRKKKPNWLPIAAAVLCLAVAATIFLKNGKDITGGEKAAQVISEGGILVIPVSEVSAAARFHPVEVNGTPMEIIAVKDSQGNIRTAFNTCQICYGSGMGYYVREGSDLVCQNCRNHFTVDQVEIESGGCNPWPVFPESKTVTEASIAIPYDCLEEATRIFANWKTTF